MYRRNPNFPTVFLKKEKDPPSPETNEKPLIIYVCCPSKERKNSVIKVGHRKAKPPLASYILSIHVLPLRKVITILEQVLVIISIKRVIRKRREKKKKEEIGGRKCRSAAFDVSFVETTDISGHINLREWE